MGGASQTSVALYCRWPTIVDHEVSAVLLESEAEDNNTVAFDLRMANLTLDAKSGSTLGTLHRT